MQKNSTTQHSVSKYQMKCQTNKFWKIFIFLIHANVVLTIKGIVPLSKMTRGVRGSAKQMRR